MLPARRGGAPWQAREGRMATRHRTHESEQRAGAGPKRRGGRKRPDGVTRLMHAVLAAAFLGAWLTASLDGLRAWHIAFGYAAAGALLSRVAWSLRRPRTSLGHWWPALVSAGRRLRSGRVGAGGDAGPFCPGTGVGVGGGGEGGWWGRGPRGGMGVAGGGWGLGVVGAGVFRHRLDPGSAGRGAAGARGPAPLAGHGPHGGGGDARGAHRRAGRAARPLHGVRHAVGQGRSVR